MISKCVHVMLESHRIVDSDSFHRVFAKAFGFPDFYGANMDAWIDCMSSLRSPDDHMVAVSLASDELLLIEATDAEGFRSRLPDVFADFTDCVAFVNDSRFVSQGEPPAIGLILL